MIYTVSMSGLVRQSLFVIVSIQGHYKILIPIGIYTVFKGSPTWKGLISWLSCVSDVFLCFIAFPNGVLGQVYCLFVSIPDICLLPYF